jgi:hypothetical protein
MGDQQVPVVIYGNWREDHLSITMRKLLPILLLLAAACNQQPGPAVPEERRNQLHFAVRAQNLRPTNFEEDSLVARLDNTDFTITYSGKMYWGTNPADSFQLATDLLVEKAYLYKTGDTLLVFFVETNNEEAGSRVQKIDLRSRKAVWNAEIAGFNLGMPYIKDHFAYLTTIGFVGKLDLHNGRYAYRCEDLYDREVYAFNAFDTILFRDSLTLFLSTHDPTSTEKNGKRVDTVIVDEKKPGYRVVIGFDR